jgi:hypothetical protein
MCICVHVENMKAVIVPEAHYVPCSPVLYSSGEWNARVKTGTVPLPTGPTVTAVSKTSIK